MYTYLSVEAINVHYKYYTNIVMTYVMYFFILIAIDDNTYVISPTISASVVPYHTPSSIETIIIIASAIGVIIILTVSLLVALVYLKRRSKKTKQSM